MMIRIITPPTVAVLVLHTLITIVYLLKNVDRKNVAAVKSSVYKKNNKK